MDFALFSKLDGKDQLKFVISDSADFDYAVDVISKYSIKAKVIFQPVYGKNIEWLTNAVLENNLYNVRVLPQLHKIVWGEKRGV